MSLGIQNNVSRSYMYAVFFANYAMLLATETLVAKNYFRIITLAFDYVVNWYLSVTCLYHPNT